LNKQCIILSRQQGRQGTRAAGQLGRQGTWEGSWEGRGVFLERGVLLERKSPVGEKQIFQETNDLRWHGVAGGRKGVGSLFGVVTSMGRFSLSTLGRD